MAFSEKIEIVNISNLNKVSDLALDDIIIVNDVSENESKTIELEKYNTFINKNLTLSGLADVAVGQGVGRDLKRGHGLIWNGNYWINDPIVEEAPIDGNSYYRMNGTWQVTSESGVQSVEALAGLENIGSETEVRLQVDQNWFDVRYAQRSGSLNATDITVTNSESLSEQGRLEYDDRGNFTYYPIDSSDFLTLETLPPETDPLFSASTASGIRPIDVQSWNTAFSWGNHADAGYVVADDLVLNTLNDVNVANIKDGHVLKYSESSGSWYNGEGGLGKLGDMYDVNTAGTGDGWGLLYDASSEFWLSSPLLLEKLTDVQVTGVTPGDYLGWDGDNWVNVTQEEIDGIDIIGGLGIEVQDLGPVTKIVDLDANLNDLKDCIVASATNGDYLRHWNGVWVPADGDTVVVNNPAITLRPGAGMTGGGTFYLNQANAQTITFNSSAVSDGEGAFYELGAEEGNSGNVHLKLDSTVSGDESRVTIVAGSGISISNISENRFTINGIPGEASVPTLQQVLDKGNVADRDIKLKRNVGTPQETGTLVSSRGYIEITDESTGQPHLQFRNAIGGSDDYDWEIRQETSSLYFKYDSLSDNGAKVVTMGNVTTKFGDATKSDGVKIHYGGRIEITDETSGTPEIEFRNAIGGSDSFDWRFQQLGRTFRIDHDKDDGIHRAIVIDATNSDDAGTIILGERRNKDGMDLLVHGDIYDEDDFTHPMMGAKIWGTVTNKEGDQGRIKMGSKRKNGNYNFSASPAGVGKVRINFSPDLDNNDYCVVVSSYDDEGDHAAGVSSKDNGKMTIFSKDLETSNPSSNKDYCNELMFAVFFINKNF